MLYSIKEIGILFVRCTQEPVLGTERDQVLGRCGQTVQPAAVAHERQPHRALGWIQ